jgi:hypothetical protein
MQQVELTVKAALEGNEASTKALYKELYKLYLEAKAQLKPSDFASKADYDFVFDQQNNTGERSDYLARFAALGLANQQFNKLLQFDTAVDTRALGAGKTLFDRLMNVYEKLLALLSAKITDTFAGQRADSKLETLVDQLVDVEARKREAIKSRDLSDKIFDPLESGIKKGSDYLREKATDALGSDLVRDSSSAVVRATGVLARAVAGGYVDKYFEQQRKLRDKLFDEKDGVLAGVVNEVQGPLEMLSALLRAVKQRETVRKKLITENAAMVLKAFKNGNEMTKEDASSVTAVFMRTGLHNLLEHFSMAEIETLLNSPAELNKAIASFEGKLSSRLKDFHIQQANGLGVHLATGANPLDVLMMNAHIIARMSGTQFAKQITEQEASREEGTIAALVSLYAMKYTSTNNQKLAKEVLRTENARTDGENGAQFLMQLHKQLEAESLKRLFNGKPALMQHGYTPDIVNPHTNITVANDENGKALMAQGYSKGAKIWSDPAHPDQEAKHIYVLRDGGLSPWLSQIVSLTSMKAKGSAVHSGYMNTNDPVGLENAQLQATISNKKLTALSTLVDPRRDMTNELRSNMAPTYNEDGEIVGWRYLMQGATKDNLLERDNRFDQIMGTLAGSIYDKETSQQHNEKAMLALREQFNEDNAINPEAYIEVGENSSDPELREIWNLLPKATRDQVRKLWGRNGMKVRKDSLDIVFGYRKLSAADFLRKEREALDGMQKIARNFFHLYATTRGMSDEQADNYAKRLGVLVTKGERGWQEIVGLVKDIVVVKNIFTTLGNIYSNDSLLFAKGAKDRWQHQAVAIRAALDYQNHTRELLEVQTKLDTGYTQGNEAAMRNKVSELRDLIDRNPVRPLIDAGLMPTIVDDVAQDEDIYSYKTWLTRKAEPITDRVPGAIKTVGKNVLLARDTKGYKFLSKTAQLSDFTARYALYQHLITREENPLSQEEAITEAADSFIGYDKALPRLLQYTDDMGITPFSKYFLRIQRVLMDTLRENPARVLAMLMAGQLIDLGPIVLESSWVHRLGNNPLNSGALQIFGVVDELPAVGAAMALVK